MWPSVEDLFEDVLGKAMNGLELSADELAERAGLDLGSVEALLAGRYNPQAADTVCDVLELNGEALNRLARTDVSPAAELPTGVSLHNAPFPVPGYPEMTVNSYAVRPPDSSCTLALIDAGTDFERLLKKLPPKEKQNIVLFLTHTHADHVAHFQTLSALSTKSYTPQVEPYFHAQAVREGDVFALGDSWRLKALMTPGHSVGGTSYLLEGPEVPVAFVGDAIFCCSMGKANNLYSEALSAIRDQILTLPDATVLCPGHGPPTTVGYEKAHNPFFA